MSYTEMYNSKHVTLEGVYDILCDGDYIISVNNSTEPKTFLRHLHEVHGKVKGLCMQMGGPTFYPEIFKEKYGEDLEVLSTFYGSIYKEFQKQRRVSYIPVHYRNLGKDVIYHMKHIKKKIRYMIVSVSPMDKHGYFTTGANALALTLYREYADRLIVEVNEAVPRTFGDTPIHISEVFAIYDSEDNAIEYTTPAVPTQEDRLIGKAIAEMVNDGDTLQLGIGGIPSACAAELSNKQDLGIHTEMFNDGVRLLCESGAVTNRRKNYFQNKIVTTFSARSRAVLDYIDNNHSILHLAVSFVNSPETISRNDNFVSINTALQIDLMGQCCSEAVQTRQISGTGGQTETVIGAKESKGGRSIIALRSTRQIKQPDGSKKRISTIFPVHPEGSVISLTRNDVDFVVTEYGMAALRGATLKERSRSLIDIAHPDYRAGLEEEAKRLWLL